ncbi:MAG: hypothetical protein KKB51_22320 [Candidatus Riflebacteria bacterium]|nr:hypothetical protein [Candidatus Riflebacteria bacterium]
MKLSGREFLRNINDFFSQANYETEMILMFIVPIGILIVLFFYVNSRRTSGNPFDSIPAKDMEFIETVRLQKGLEEFDRDFLLEMAIIYHLKPEYIFIDLEVFVKAEISLKTKILEDSLIPEKSAKFQHLLKLKDKLFKNS